MKCYEKFLFFIVSLSFAGIVHFSFPNAVSAEPFDHSHKLWQATLNNYLQRVAYQSYFNYEGLKKNRETFNKYLKSLSSVTRKQYKGFNEKEKLAFLINAYNAYTVELIISNYPVKSIRNIGGLFSNPWKKEFFVLLGDETYLDYIEHAILRKEFNEPRIHFSINCAAIGCPSLQEKAYTAGNLEALFEKGGSEFLKDPSKNKLNEENQTLKISKVFYWFKSDFEKKYGSVEAFLAPRITSDEQLQKSILQGEYNIIYANYDWSLIDSR